MCGQKFKRKMNIFDNQIPEQYKSFLKNFCGELVQNAANLDRQGKTPLDERKQLQSSGLFNLIIPKEYGGLGESWENALKIVREIARADSSIAHIFSYQMIGVSTPHFYGQQNQKDHYYTITAQGNLIWGNAMNPRDPSTQLETKLNKFELNGSKSFCSGSVGSDVLIVTAHNEENQLKVLVVPSNRKGVKIHNDWNCMGQRLTDSGSVSFDQVEVLADEILEISHAEQNNTFSSLRPLIIQLMISNILIGIAQGAIDLAIEFTRNKKKGWQDTPKSNFCEDPYILNRYGEMISDTQAAMAIADLNATNYQNLWNNSDHVSEEERGKCAIGISQTKVIANKVSLAISSNIFDVMGAKSTLDQLRLDRFWRNARTFTLHDNIDYKTRDIGNWALNHTYPKLGYYS